MYVLLAVFGIVVLIAGALWLHAASNRRLVERRFANREPLPADQFGQRLFSKSQAQIATKLRELLADELSFDLARLRPEDEFVRHLRVEEFDSLAVAEFVIAAEREFEVKLSDQDLIKIRTFGELVNLVDRELSTREHTA